MSDERSILCLYRKLIAMRSQHRALSIGDFALLPSGEDTLLYQRSDGRERLTVALNFGREERAIELPSSEGKYAILISTALDRTGRIAGANVTLRPDEGVIVGFA